MPGAEFLSWRPPSSRVGSSPKQPVPNTPHEIGQDGDQTVTPGRHRYRGADPPAERQHSGSAGQRIAGHRQRHPLLPVAKHQRPGAASTTPANRVNPTSVAIAAGTRTAATASTNSGRAEPGCARRYELRTPPPQQYRCSQQGRTAMSATGTASEFRCRRGPARLPRVPGPARLGWRRRPGRTPVRNPPARVQRPIARAGAPQSPVINTPIAQRIRGTPPPGARDAQQRYRHREHETRRRQPRQCGPEGKRTPQPHRCGAHRCGRGRNADE